MLQRRIPRKLVALAFLSLIIVLPLGLHRILLFAGPSPQESGAGGESEYEVVKLLTRLFSLIKRNYVQTLDISREIHDADSDERRVRLLAELKDRLAFVDLKGQEYLELMPGLRRSYPKLETIISSFSKDVNQIADDLGRIRNENHLDIPDVAQATEVPQSADRVAAGPAFKQSKEGLTFPITLEVRTDEFGAVAGRKIIFKLEPPPRSVGAAGLISDQEELVDSRVVYTDKTGKATVQMKVDRVLPRMQIRRIITPDQSQTICRLKIEQAEDNQAASAPLRGERSYSRDL